jgi:hypothetical protein
MKTNLNVKVDKEIEEYIYQTRSYSWNVNDQIFVYPLNFVPRLKPREHNVIPSPICLPRVDRALISAEYFFDLCSDSK